MATSDWPHELLMTPALRAALLADRIGAPTAIQAQAAEPLLQGRDAVLQSGTGTGKTLAYLLPLLQRLHLDASRRLVVLAPSPELAVQILRVVERYKPPGVGSIGLFGGANLTRQLERLKKQPRVIVGTPGRTLELIGLRKLKAAQIGALVLDEADRILEPAIAATLRDVCSRPEFTAQLVCACATEGAAARAFAQQVMAPSRATVSLGHAALQGAIVHRMVDWQAHPGGKDAALLQLVRQHDAQQVLIFVNKIYAVTHLYQLLQSHGIACLGLCSERHKHERAAALRAFRAGTIRALVATDTAARGLDVPQLQWVLHYEASRDAETYLHRAGRVGRAGRAGQSVVLAARRDAYLLRDIGRHLQITFEAA